MAKGASALPGFRDFYPEEFAARAHIQNTWRDVARRFGFVEYDGPPLEPLELYTKKSGDEIVGQLYTFKDKGDRNVALRPEMTPTFARMVGARANAMPKPVRWFSIPQLFRYERQQKGRLREHFQLNVDIVGEKGVVADAELMAVAIECMRAFGLGPRDVRARVSDRGLVSAILQAGQADSVQAAKVLAAYDKILKQPDGVFRANIQEIGLATATHSAVVVMPTLSTVAALQEAINSKSVPHSPEVDARVNQLAQYFGYLEALGVAEWVDLDVSVVRGLDYYTGIVFELYDAQGEFRAICGGGRYDTLLASLGGADLPALGFGMGDVVLGALLKARGKTIPAPLQLDYWIAYEDPAKLPEAMKLASKLRRMNRAVEYSLKAMPLGKQLKAAAASGAKNALIIRLDGTDIRRDLSTGNEVPFTLSDG